MPWAALARLQVPGNSRCTAFLVDPQTAVTAAHCLHSRRMGRMVPAGSVHLLLGYDKGSYTQHAVAASFTVAEGWNPGGGPGAGGLDVAVIRLPRPMAPAGQTIPLLPATLRPGTPLMLGGYGQDRAEALLADTGCKVQGYTDGVAPMLVHDCGGTNGTSGAPLLVRADDGTWRAVGVQATARQGGAGGTAVPSNIVLRMLPAPSPPGRGPG